VALNTETGINQETDWFSIEILDDGPVESHAWMHNQRWPRPDGGPIQGANPLYRWWKAVSLTPEQMVSDHKFEAVDGFDLVPTTPAAATGLPYGERIQKQVLVRYSDDVLTAQVVAQRNTANGFLFPSENVPTVLVLVDQAMRASVPTEEQKQLLSWYAKVQDAMAQNEVNKNRLISAIVEAKDYDILAGWITSIE
jgi:hypothetical protein